MKRRDFITLLAVASIGMASGQSDPGKDVLGTVSVTVYFGTNGDGQSAGKRAKEVTPEVARRPSVIRLFAGLTLLWAAVQLVNAAGTFGMLVSLPVGEFVALKTIMSLSLSAAAITITIAWALRTAKRERLMFAVAPVIAR